MHTYSSADVQAKERRRVKFLRKQGAKPDTVLEQAPITRFEISQRVVKSAALIRQRLRAGEVVLHGTEKVSGARSRHAALQVRIAGKWVVPVCLTNAHLK